MVLPRGSSGSGGALRGRSRRGLRLDKDWSGAFLLGPKSTGPMAPAKQGYAPMETVRLARHGEVAIATIDNPPVNALGQALRTDLARTIAEAGADPAVSAIVIAATEIGRASCRERVL